MQYKKEDYIFEMKDNNFKSREEEIVYSVLMNFYSIGFADMKLFFNESYMNNVLKEDIKKFVFSLKNFDYVNEWIAKNKQTYSNLLPKYISSKDYLQAEFIKEMKDELEEIEKKYKNNI